MASSFNTLQRRELFFFSHCKCFSTSTTLPLHNSVTFPLKLSPLFLVKAPVSAKTPVSSRILSSLDSNSSAETAQLSKISEILDSGYSSFERIKVKEERNGKRVVDDNNSGRRRRKGGNFDYGRKKLNNGSEYGSFRRGSRRGERKLGEIVGKVDNGDVRKSHNVAKNGGERKLGEIVEKVANGDVRKNHNVAKNRGERKLGKIVGKVANGDVRKNHNVAKNRGGDKSPSFVSKWVRESNSTSSVFDNRSVEKEAIKGDSGNKKVKKKEKVPKKSKTPSPEFLLRIGLDMCSKKGDVMGAISLYDSAVKNGTRMAQYHYTVLLYLCSSAAVGVVQPAKSGSASRNLDTVAPQNLDEGFDSDDEEEDGDSDDVGDEAHNKRYQNQAQKLEGNEIMVSDDVKKYSRERGFEIYERMCSDRVQMNEAALTSVARMAMAMGDGDMAFDVVKQMKSLGISPKLRSYGPALSVYSGNGDVEKAFAVEEHMLENGVDPEEPELEALLRVSVETGKADRVYYVLHKLRTKVRSVSPSTADLIEKWFKSKESSRIGKRKWDLDMIAQTMENVGGGWHGKGWLGRGKWCVSRTSVDTDGLCKCCGERLALIDLDPEETERFAESVATIATKREKNSSFQKFQRWLDYYGPFEAVVDAANVGLYSQRLFKPSKVNVIVNGIRQMHPSRKWPLIVLHNRRVTGGKQDKPIHRESVERWKNADALYATPTGSNDDWYWLYAAIRFKCLLVTNDEMRDHTFQLLGNDFFPKWKERHQVRFSFSELGPIFHMPPPCSVVIQESEKGHWHVPIASEHQSEEERIWLCVTRPKSLIWNQNNIAGVDSKDSEEDIKNKRQHGSSISHSSHQMIALDLK